MTKSFNNKAFLNKDDFNSIASIGYRYCIEKYGNSKPYMTGEMWISDCNRNITLKLDCVDDEGIENTLYKLSKIIEIAEKAKEDLLKANSEYKKMVKEYEIYKKENG